MGALTNAANQNHPKGLLKYLMKYCVRCILERHYFCRKWGFGKRPNPVLWKISDIFKLTRKTAEIPGLENGRKNLKMMELERQFCQVNGKLPKLIIEYGNEPTVFDPFGKRTKK